MEKRALGWTGLKVSTVGLGTWAMGGAGWVGSWGPQDDKESIATIRRAIDLGVNWLDTAPIYGFGHCEEVIGQAVRGLHEKPLIATKCSRSWDANGKVFPNLKKETVRTAVEASLKRLRIDVIDLYQLHWPDPDKDIEEAWETIADLVRAGKIRYAGVCNASVAQIKRLQPIHPVASLQSSYSMLSRGLEGDVLTYCASQRIGVIAYSPMEQGLLAGRFTRERVKNLPVDDHRRRESRFQVPALSLNLQLVEKLRPIAERHGRTIAQLAVAWVLRRPEVTAAIVGARRPSQLEETIIAGDWRLSAEDLRAIDAPLEAHDKALART